MGGIRAIRVIEFFGTALFDDTPQVPWEILTKFLQSQRI
jgi:hypothetical protein